MAITSGTIMTRRYAIKSITCTALMLIFAMVSLAPAMAQKRVALVIGNSAYLHTSPLANPERDAKLIAKTLRASGFEVFEHTNVGFRTMRRAFAAYTSKLQSYGRDAVGLIFYAGHGMQVNGTNYMVPIDAQIAKEADVEIEGVSASSLMRSISLIGNKLNIIILDACRNNPYRAMFRSTSNGLARMDAPIGSMVAFSTAPGMVAADGSSQNSPYSENLARAMSVPGLKIEDMFKRVRNEVFKATGGAQVPWESSSIFKDFYFNKPVLSDSGLPSGQPGQVWSVIQSTDSRAVLEAFIVRFPNTPYAAIAKARMKELQTASQAPNVPVKQSRRSDTSARQSRPKDNRLRAVMVENGNLISSGLRWDVYTARLNSDGKRKHLTYSTEASPKFKLKEGRYFITARYGNAIATEEVQVRLDQAWGRRFVLNAGLLQATASLSAGANAIKKNIRWDIYHAAKDEDGNRKHITYNTTWRPKFILPSGKYYLRAAHGNAITGAELIIEPGKTLVQVINMNAGRLILTGALSEDGKTLKSGLRWDIYHAALDEDDKRRHITYATKWRSKFILPSGKYFVLVSLGSVRVGREFSVAAGKVSKHRFILGAGRLILDATLAEGGKPLKSGVRFDVYGSELDEDGNRKHITYNTAWRSKFVLPKGSYVIWATHGNGKGSIEIPIKPGGVTKHTINLNAGRLILDAVLAKGQQPLKSGVRFDIYGSELDEDGKRKHVTYSTAWRSKLVLPKGSYVIWATHGSGKGSIEISMKPGLVDKYSIDLNAGRIKLIGRAKDGTRLTKGLRWDIYGTTIDFEGRRQSITYSTAAQPILTLNSGKYLLYLTNGKARLEQEISVNAGDQKTIEVTLN